MSDIHDFLKGIRTGTVLTGTVASIHNFGVFVHLDGEPAEHGSVGFIRIPDITWSHFNDVNEVLSVGKRVRGEVIYVDDDFRMQVGISLKALEPDPYVPLVDRVGEVLHGQVRMVSAEYVFVRIADGFIGLVPQTLPAHDVREGDEVSVEIVEIDLKHHEVHLRLASQHN